MSGGAPFTFRAGRHGDDDAAAFCALSNSLYARPVDRPYYAWQFFGGAVPTCLGMATTADGELAGCLALHVRNAATAGPDTAWAIDIMTAPRFERRGIFRGLVDFTAGAVAPHRPAALCVMANERARAASIGGLGWHEVAALVTHLRPITPSTVPAVRRLRFLPLTSFTHLGGWLAKPADHIPVRQGLFVTQRSADYLDWRFGTNPRYRYECFAAVLDTTPVGYVVLKAFRDPLSNDAFGDIVDLLWSNDDPVIVADLLAFALQRFARAGIPRAAAWLQTNTPLDAAGRELGFHPVDQRRYFCVHVLAPDAAWLADPKRWYLTMADAEVY